MAARSRVGRKELKKRISRGSAAGSAGRPPASPHAYHSVAVPATGRTLESAKKRIPRGSAGRVRGPSSCPSAFGRAGDPAKKRILPRVLREILGGSAWVFLWVDGGFCFARERADFNVRRARRMCERAQIGTGGMRMTCATARHPHGASFAWRPCSSACERTFGLKCTERIFAEGIWMDAHAMNT